MKFALVLDGAVRQIFEEDPLLPIGGDHDGFAHPIVLEVPSDVDLDWVMKDGALVPQEEAFSDLPDLLAALKSEVDTSAEIERRKYITPGEGQAMTYLQKVDEARRLMTDPSPVGESYPLLSAEVGITAQDIAGVADIVMQAFEQWKCIGSAIEAIRLRAKAALDLAENAGQARAVFDQVEWPSQQDV